MNENQDSSQSGEIAELLRALDAFQQDNIKLSRTANNPFFKSKYAPLDEVLELVTPKLHEHGLALVQSTLMHSEIVVLRTVLAHIQSGQWLASEYPLLPAKQNDPQQLGSAMTYARRYVIKAVCGLAEADDDGNFASGKAKSVDQFTSRKQTPPKAPTPALIVRAKPAPAPSASQASMPVANAKPATPAPAKPAPAVPAKPARPAPVPAGNPATFVLNFGPNKGRTLDDVYKGKDGHKVIEKLSSIVTGGDPEKEALKKAAIAFLAQNNGHIPQSVAA